MELAGASLGSRNARSKRVDHPACMAVVGGLDGQRDVHSGQDRKAVAGRSWERQVVFGRALTPATRPDLAGVRCCSMPAAAMLLQPF